MSEVCFICHARSWHDPSGENLSVQQCDRCDEYICERHAEVDYDLQGDPPRYVNTQWVCANRIECLEASL